MPVEWSILLSDDDQLAALNRAYRNRPLTTDVLSFPAADDLHPGLLGDVVISVEQARRQALAIGRDLLEPEIVRLLAHGLCHLRGYDHQRADEKEAMRAAEAALLDPLGLVPLIGGGR